MRYINLTQGLRALVDDKNYDWLSTYKWCVSRKGNTSYAVSRSKGGTLIAMHRLIMGFPRGKLVDHRDENGLNNVEVNLRVATVKQNANNRGKQVNNKTGYKGVSWDKARGKYRAVIMVAQKQVHLGRYNSKIMAALAYNEAALELHGEFAYQNII